MNSIPLGSERGKFHFREGKGWLKAHFEAGIYCYSEYMEGGERERERYAPFGEN